jgi:hypothetical protein
MGRAEKDGTVKEIQSIRVPRSLCSEERASREKGWVIGWRRMAETAGFGVKNTRKGGGRVGPVREVHLGLQMSIPKVLKKVLGQTSNG